MSAIESMLRVMTLRDAEAIVMEAGKIPTLRRRGQVEQMAMPAIEATMIAQFAAPHLVGKDVSSGPLMVALTVDGVAYVVTFEKAAAGLKMTARKGTASKPATAPASPPPAPASAPVPVPVPVPAEATSALDQEDRKARLARLLAQPVALAAARGASDVIVSTGQPVRVRVDGRLETAELAAEDDELAACLRGIVGAVDFSLELDGVRVRVNAFDHLGGYAVAARLIRDRVPGLAELGLPAELAAVIEERDGLVLVCGPTGSGKSTTVAALIDVLDQRRAAHVITIEDPIEYRFLPRQCLVHQRELGAHVPSFAAGLRAALREVPDVILLGELRDRETLAAALTAAETGHLVLATLHAPNAAGAIDRMIDAFPEEQQRQVRNQLAASLRTVITQYLLPRRDGGRAVAIELVPVTTAVANIIRKGDLHTLPTAIQSGRDAGMIPLERSLAKLLDSGAVSAQAVKRIAADHDLLSSLASRLR
jgi:twitching motility protein PilT